MCDGLERVAYHEAGHVVAFLAFDYPFEYVTIFHPHGCGDESCPHVHAPFVEETQKQEKFQDQEVEQLIMIRLAGIAAERIRRNDDNKTPLPLDDRRSMDYVRSGDLYEQVHGITTDRGEQLRQLLDRVQGLLEKPRIWRQVEVVAQALLQLVRSTEVVRLTFNEVRQIVDGVDQS